MKIENKVIEREYIKYYEFILLKYFENFLCKKSKIKN